MLKKVHSIYALLSLSAAVLSFYKLGYLASGLTSESFGMYSLVILSFVYVGYVGSLGGNEYMLKSGATLSSSETVRLFLVRNNALCYGFLGVLGVSLLVLVASLFFYADGVPVIIYTALALALVTYPYNIFESYYRSQQKLLVFAGMLFIKAVLVIFGIYILADEYGVLGAVLSEIIAVLVVVLFFLAREYRNILTGGLERPRNALINILSNGFYVCMSNLFRNLSLTADRYVVVFIFGLYYFGIYSFVMIVYQGVVLLSGIVMNVIGPKMIRDYNADESRSLLFAFLCKTSFLVLVAALVIYPVLYYLVPEVVAVFFEHYDSEEVYFSLALVYWASVISFFIFLFDWYFICLSKEYVISSLSLFSLFLICCSMAVLSLYNFEFTSYMLFLLLSKALVFSIMLCLAFKLRKR